MQRILGMNPFKLLKAKCPALWAAGKKYGWKLAYSKLRLQLPMVRRTLARQSVAMRQKERINVCFILWNPSYWKTDSLFQLMLKHPRFNPVIAIEPNLGYAILADREREMESAKAYFREKGYPVLDEWEENDIRRVFHPDIIFSPNPYESTTEALLKGAFKELWCYVPYCFRNSEQSCSFDTVCQNKYWYNFLENDYYMGIAKRLMTNGASNALVTGFPFTDTYFYPDQFPVSEKAHWKELPGNLKRVIWAPHWALHYGSVLQAGTFPLVADAMLELAKEYAERIQFVFKPHPGLRKELYKYPGWGHERTDAYYAAWAELPNTQLENGEYTHLFLDSDAMIHDCGSFIIEYLLTGKPCCYLQDPARMATFNQFTNEALDTYYRAKDMASVRHFLDRVVLGGEDEKQPLRQAYAAKYLTPPHGQSAAQNIIDAILGEKS